jgi:hypothetical protein
MNKKYKITNEEVEHSPKHPFFISPPSSLKEGSAKDCAEEGVVLIQQPESQNLKEKKNKK